MLYKVMIDNQRYDSKPINQDTIITKRLKTIELTLEEIIGKVTTGYCLRPAILEGGTTSKNFKEQQVFLFDVDENANMQKTLDTLSELEIYPFCIYASSNYSEENQKHRVGIVLDKVITDAKECGEIIIYINKIIAGDKKTTNIARYFYGTNYEASYVDLESIVKYDYIKELAFKNKPILTKNSTKKDAQSTENTKVNGGEIKDTHINRTDIFNNIYNIYNSSIYVSGFEQGGDKQDISTVREVFINSFLSKDITSFAYENGNSIIDAIKRIDIRDFFGGSNFSCIFHEDNNPSASIYIDENGYYRYKCFSCDINITLIDIIAYLEGVTDEIGGYVNAFDLIRILLKYYNFNIINTKFKNEQEKIYYTIIDYLRDINDDDKVKTFKAKYPKLTTILKRKTNINILNTLATFKMNCLMKYPGKINLNKHVFYTSLREIASFIDKHDITSIMDKVDLLTYTGLINKVADKDVPKELIKQAEAYRHDNNYKYTTQFFTFPIWTNKLLKEAEQRCVEWRKSGATVKGSSVLQYQNLELAETVKPKSCDKEMTDKEKKSKEILLNWVNRTLKRNGLFLKEDYLNYAYKNYIGEVLAEKIITSITKTLSLQRAIVTKATIKEYGIKTNAFRKTCFIPK